MFIDYIPFISQLEKFHTLNTTICGHSEWSAVQFMESDLSTHGHSILEIIRKQEEAHCSFHYVGTSAHHQCLCKLLYGFM